MADIIVPGTSGVNSNSAGNGGYSMKQWEADIAKIKPRFFDIYFLGPLMIYFAATSKRPLGVWPRRILFTAGVYTIYRNWQAYKAVPSLVMNAPTLITESMDVSTNL